MKKVKSGDIIEIKTKRGLTYAQYTHKHRMYGALIRIFDEVYQERPESFQKVVYGKIRFSTFFPLQAALSKGIFEVVGNEPIRDDLKIFPIFRGGSIDQLTKKVKTWWLWDGEKEWRIGNLSDEQRKLPIRGVWNDTMLIHRIETSWTPENDPT